MIKKIINNATLFLSSSDSIKDNIIFLRHKPDDLSLKYNDTDILQYIPAEKNNTSILLLDSDNNVVYNDILNLPPFINLSTYLATVKLVYSDTNKATISDIINRLKEVYSNKDIMNNISEDKNYTIFDDEFVINELATRYNIGLLSSFIELLTNKKQNINNIDNDHYNNILYSIIRRSIGRLLFITSIKVLADDSSFKDDSLFTHSDRQLTILLLALLLFQCEYDNEMDNLIEFIDYVDNTFITNAFRKKLFDSNSNNTLRNILFDNNYKTFTLLNSFEYPKINIQIRDVYELIITYLTRNSLEIVNSEDINDEINKYVLQMSKDNIIDVINRYISQLRANIIGQLKSLFYLFIDSRGFIFNYNDFISLKLAIYIERKYNGFSELICNINDIINKCIFVINNSIVSITEMEKLVKDIIFVGSNEILNNINIEIPAEFNQYKLFDINGYNLTPKQINLGQKLIDFSSITIPFGDKYILSTEPLITDSEILNAFSELNNIKNKFSTFMSSMASIITEYNIDYIINDGQLIYTIQDFDHYIDSLFSFIITDIILNNNQYNYTLSDALWVSWHRTIDIVLTSYGITCNMSYIQDNQIILRTEQSEYDIIFGEQKIILKYPFKFPISSDEDLNDYIVQNIEFTNNVITGIDQINNVEDVPFVMDFTLDTPIFNINDIMLSNVVFDVFRIIDLKIFRYKKQFLPSVVIY